MQIIPAIDIYQGMCVRLIQGKKSTFKVYYKNPEDAVRMFTDQEVEILHIVDLSSAIDKDKCNIGIISNIIKNHDIKIQLGGGMDSLNKIGHWLCKGAYRIIIGSKAVKNPEFAKNAVKNFGTDKICVSVDFKNKMVAVNGWEKVTSINFIDFGLKMKDYGISRFIVTDISRDGSLKGPGIEKTLWFSKNVHSRITISGGISSLHDLNKIRKSDIKGVDSVIIGKAFYENLFTYSEAIDHINSMETK